jgi:hypothetical protein
MVLVIQGLISLQLAVLMLYYLVLLGTCLCAAVRYSKHCNHSGRKRQQQHYEQWHRHYRHGCDARQ